MADGPYSAQVLDHFAHPRNLGRLPEANGHGVVGDLRDSPTQIAIAIRVEDGRIAAARFRTFGCSAAIAASSMATTLITGQSTAEAAALTAERITAALGGLPPERVYAPTMAAAAVRGAIADWAAREGVEVERGRG